MPNQEVLLQHNALALMYSFAVTWLRTLPSAYQALQLSCDLATSSFPRRRLNLNALAVIVNLLLPHPDHEVLALLLQRLCLKD